MIDDASSLPADDDDDYDDVNNPFYEAPPTLSTSSVSATSDLLAKFRPGTVSVEPTYMFSIILTT